MAPVHSQGIWWSVWSCQWKSVSPLVDRARPPAWAVQPTLRERCIFPITHFSTYLFYFFRSLHDNRVFFQIFLSLSWNELFSQSPLHINIWSQWLFRRQNWYEQDFCRLCFLTSKKAQWYACTSTGQEKNEPHTEESILPVKSFWNPWQRVPAHFFVSRTWEAITWPRSMGTPAGRA